MDNKIIKAQILGMKYDVEVWDKKKKRFLAIASVSACDILCNDFDYVFLHKSDESIYNSSIDIYLGRN